MSSSAAPATAQAVRIHQVGGPEQLKLEEIPLAAPKPSEVQVELFSVGVNYIDTYHRTGLYKLPLPAVIGREGAGIVRSVGSSVTNFSVGDRVVFFAGGAYATRANVDAAQVVKITDGLSFKEAVAAHIQGLTAQAFTTSLYPVKKGDTVLIHAAAGGTGNLMVQMCKIRGATVIATVGSAEKAALAKEAGADHVINYNEQEFAPEVRKLTNGVGVNVVFDGVGKSTFDGSLKSLKRRGTLVSFGNSSGSVPPLDLMQLTTNGSLFLARPTVLHFVEERAELDARVAEIHGWIKASQLKLRIAKEFPLAEAAQAHEALESRKYAGKILLLVKDE